MQTPKYDLVISDCAILPMNNSDLIMNGIIAVKLKMAKTKGATALGNEREVGSLEAGKRADIVLIDLSKPHLKLLHNICANLVYSARGSDVDTRYCRWKGLDGEPTRKNFK